MDVKIGKIHDKVIIDKEYMTLDQKLNMINKLYVFVKTEKENEQEPSKALTKAAELYIEDKYKMDIHLFSRLPDEVSFMDHLNSEPILSEDILQYIRFDDATDDFFSLYLNQIGSLNPTTIRTILSGMLDSLDKHSNLMSTLGDFLKRQYIKNPTEYPNLLKLVHVKIHEKRLYDNINVATKWDEFFNVT